MKKTFLRDIERCLKHKAVIWHSQYEKVPSNVISFHNDITHLAREGKAVDVIILGVSKAFDTVPHGIHLEKLSNCNLNEFVLHWVIN